MLPWSASADYTTLWSLGNWNGNPEEFQWTSGPTSAPGSATARDNDYYFAGTYPSPIGTVATAEPWTNFENGMSDWAPSRRIHFNLTAAQATSTARIRLNFHQCWGSWELPGGGYNEGYGIHAFEVRWRTGPNLSTTVVLGTRTSTYQGSFYLEANAGTFTPVVGENVLEIRRLGVPSSSPDGSISADALTLEIDPTAQMNADGDGLPRWWEQDHGFNDNLATDAALDSDGDGLTNLQEFTRGTLPRDADTDDDGLKDGVETGTGTFVSSSSTGTDPLKADSDGDTVNDGDEVATVPMANPNLADTDGDGAGDAWELRTTYNPASNTSTPPAFSSAIGIKFVSDVNPLNTLVPQAVTGFFPQRNWNCTWPLTGWRSGAGTKGDIVSPVADNLVNSAGTTIPAMTLAWTANGGSWGTSNGGSSLGRLLDGYLTGNTSTQVSVALSGIPYATYEVVVYAGSGYDGAHARIRLNNDSGTDRHFVTASTRPQQSFVEPVVSDEARPWRGNTLHFRNVSGASLNVRLICNNGSDAGIHAVQIVNMSTDSDGDGMPDAWEFAHQFKPEINDAGTDADGDGLSNGAEYTRHTNPRLRDTDGDGLEDLVETATGTFVSATNTGSNPLLKDTDGDGLSDGAELALKPVMTYPTVSDSDGDGRSDGEEVTRGTNPRSSDIANPRMPVIQALGTNTFDWNVDNVQVIWDHTRGQVDEGSDWRAGDLFSISVRNYEDSSENDAVYMALTRRGGRMTWYFHSDQNGAFSSPSNDNEGIWDSDWNSPPTTDLGPLLGFSGHGAVDISDRLQLRVQGTCPTGVQTNWNVVFTLRNMDTNQTVVTRTFNGCRAQDLVQDGNALWHDGSRPPVEDRFELWTHDGVQVMFQTTPLEQTTAYSAWADNDEDGMPNAWETTYGLNINLATDAALDGDADGLTNLREYLAGTNPNDADSDDDLAKDGAEVLAGSNPMLASSKPPMHHGAPAGVVGEDLNGNGMSDAWEQWAGSFNLSALLDVDGDGMSNGDEAEAGTNPFDSKSRLWVDTQRTGNDLTLRWPLLRYKQHRVWQSADMSAWSQVAGSPVTVGEEYRQTLTAVITSGPPKFYEARVLNIDTDNDGVSDWTETNVLGSSTTNASSTRADVPVDANQDGTTEGTIRGDYATLVEQFQGAVGSGGFPGGSTAAGVSRAQASRFLMQSTFGPTLEDIQRVQQLGYESWITEQVSKPATLHATYIKEIYADMFSHRHTRNYSYGGDEPDPFLFGGNMKTAFARAAIQGEDQLRQRVAFALNQILVTSRRDANIENRCLGIADYYDIFVRHAFGNYRDILGEVTMHPVMGRYLSHAGNQKADPAINRYPDENYAREVMQLFTIGLWKLNPDGSRQLDGQGEAIPTYTNGDITQVARVMTGFWFGKHPWFAGGWTEQDYATPMSLHADRHDFGVKTLPGGLVLPARPATDDNALRDVTDSLDFLFNHPNTGVFIGKQLIQFLVTDNPSPAYVQRVGAVFANNGSGVRGDLGAVVRAILLDVEARDPRYTEGASFGRLKEPVIRAMALSRAFGMKQMPELLWWDWNDFYNDSRQEPTYAPSVFNFYRPDYKAPGTLTQNNLAAPVFQITDSYSAISFPNRLWDTLENGFRLWETYNFPVDLSREKDLAANPERLVDHLNLIFCAGKMRPSSRTFILNALSQIPAAQTTSRARVAAYLALITPEGAVMR